MTIDTSFVYGVISWILASVLVGKANVDVVRLWTVTAVYLTDDVVRYS